MSGEGQAVGSVRSVDVEFRHGRAEAGTQLRQQATLQLQGVEVGGAFGQAAEVADGAREAQDVVASGEGPELPALRQKATGASASDGAQVCSASRIWASLGFSIAIWSILAALNGFDTVHCQR
jgi:hypothetical protein